MPRQARGTLFSGLEPNKWVILFQHLEDSDGPVYYHRITNVTLRAEPDNGAETEVKVQSSNDGTIWMDEWASVTHLQPGGEMSVNVVHQRPHVRMILFSEESGRVDGTWLKGEDQVLPHLLPGEHVTMTCSSYCEQTTET